MLQQLFDAARLDALERQQRTSISELERLIETLPSAVDVYESLHRTDHIRLIAEIKRASPSRGDLAPIDNPGELAVGYQASGADAISVLTERTGFKGSLEDLQSVTKTVSIPVLRKDFISNEYQIFEARASGASFILLILAHLDNKKAQQLSDLAAQLGMGVLVETHTEVEVSRASEIGAKLIGINTRDLKTFKTDLSLFEKLANRLQEDCIRVAESSVKDVADVVRYRSAGADVVLVGEALVTGDWATLIPKFRAVS